MPNVRCSECDTLFNSLMDLEHHKEELQHWSEDDEEEEDDSDVDYDYYFGQPSDFVYYLCWLWPFYPQMEEGGEYTWRRSQTRSATVAVAAGTRSVSGLKTQLVKASYDEILPSYSSDPLCPTWPWRVSH